MHSREIQEAILDLSKQGFNNSEISRQLNIPRRTISDRVRKGEITLQIRGSSEFSVTEDLFPEYAYALGLYLGDGCIDKGPREVYRMRVTLTKTDAVVIHRCMRVLGQLFPINKVNAIPRKTEGATDITLHSKSLKSAFPQHGLGKKHHRKIWLADWQKEITHSCPEWLLAGLIDSDGCRLNAYYKREDQSYLRYDFTNFSSDILEIFADHAKRLNLHFTYPKTTRIAFYSRKDVQQIEEIFEKVTSRLGSPLAGQAAA
jgi:hypothetical protein